MTDDIGRRRRIAEAFAAAYGTTPTVWVRAPGRVDLMGSHTDYNQGFVLTLPIRRDTWIAARPRSDRIVRVRSLNLEGESRFALDAIEHDEQHRWADYVRGVAAVLREEGLPLVGFDGLVHSTVPISSGLSSSAALEVATAVLFRTLGGWEIGPLRLALLCQRAENEFVGMNCGILDQYTSLLGQEGCALLLDCRALSHQVVPLPARLSVVICDTRSRRELTGSEYGQRRAQCEEGVRLLARYLPGIAALRDVSPEQFQKYEPTLPPVIARRCRFVIEENERVLRMADALLSDDREWIHRLMMASFAGARDLYEISSPEMNAMIQAMEGAPGVVGARQAGAGFGGCMVALVEPEQVPDFAQAVRQKYRATTGIEPEIYPEGAGAGAGVLPTPEGEG
ncbi:MAG: galactokinase [Chloroflexia bacterium]